MAASTGFLDLVADQLAGFGPVSIRRMFGGAGLFRDGVMFGLVADDVLYFKVGEANRAAYAAAGAKPFTYMRKGGVAQLTSYHEVPAGILDDADALAQWAAAAYAVAKSRAQPAAAARKRRGEPRRARDRRR